MWQQLVPAVVAEDDSLRSAYMRTLIQQPTHWFGDMQKGAIPPVLVQFWDNLTTLPSDVQACLDSWEPLIHQGFTRCLYDESQALDFIITRCEPVHVEAFSRCTHPAMKCDYFRLCYLYYNGGFYVDADEQYLGGDCQIFLQDGRLKLQPLCYDGCSGNMIAPTTFINDGCHSDEWIYYVNNNPLVAPARHPVIGLALTRATHQLIQPANGRQSIQSTAGPGNLTACLVQHALSSDSRDDRDFMLLPNWESISLTPWPLSYRADERNWRLWEANENRRKNSLA